MQDFKLSLSEGTPTSSRILLYFFSGRGTSGRDVAVVYEEFIGTGGEDEVLRLGGAGGGGDVAPFCFGQGDCAETSVVGDTRQRPTFYCKGSRKRDLA